ncbi:MAG TPA: Crp/Fnr family transcriptional regulator [Gemmatimonadota bacterium]|nr:Crp/Fnr family transcriptional regulator [Gemmatimonadota bacterium]
MIDPELLRGVPSFVDVPAAGIESLAREAREVEYHPGDRIVPLIKPPEQVIFLLEGLVKLVGVSQAGNERIVYVFRPGEVLGSRILLDVSPESAYESVAMQDVRAISVGKSDFLRISEEHPELLLAVTREFARRLEGLTSRMLAAMSDEVPIRLGQLLMDFASRDGRGEEDFVPLSYPLTHEAMAQIIGASRPHTSSVLGNLELQGVLRRRSDRGLLVCPARLARMVRGEEMRAS